MLHPNLTDAILCTGNIMAAAEQIGLFLSVQNLIPNYQHISYTLHKRLYSYNYNMGHFVYFFSIFSEVTVQRCNIVGLYLAILSRHEA